ncbi:cell death-inducing p53-target protein 1-like [Branchiostoma lanceolatum]|uniref:cell death-inducing p53-target protein 1-like n=1 Tax=Branchiostoma lanceolatum TaxID=7740 RepID=UPI0011330D00
MAEKAELRERQTSTLPGQPEPGQPAVAAGNIVYNAVPQPAGVPVIIPDPPERSRVSVRVKCPSCQQVIDTVAEKKVGKFAWYVAGMVFLIGLSFPVFWLGCCVPCCMANFKDTKHTCPNCKAHVATYKIAK